VDREGRRDKLNETLSTLTTVIISQKEAAFGWRKQNIGVDLAKETFQSTIKIKLPPRKGDYPPERLCAPPYIVHNRSIRPNWSQTVWIRSSLGIKSRQRCLE
jgi:hypothetical protein